MVYLVGGYPMPWQEAKAWALRHWPDMDIFSDQRLGYIIHRYHKDRGRRMRCIPIFINGEDWLLISLYSKEDRCSTPRNFRRFPENELALKFKAELFSHEGDKELAEKTQFTTIADPFKDWQE